MAFLLLIHGVAILMGAGFVCPASLPNSLDIVTQDFHAPKLLSTSTTLPRTSVSTDSLDDRLPLRSTEYKDTDASSPKSLVGKMERSPSVQSSCSVTWIKDEKEDRIPRVIMRAKCHDDGHSKLNKSNPVCKEINNIISIIKIETRPNGLKVLKHGSEKVEIDCVPSRLAINIAKKLRRPRRRPVRQLWDCSQIKPTDTDERVKPSKTNPDFKYE